MTNAYLNAVSTAVPPYDVHQRFVLFAGSVIPEERRRSIFMRMAERSQIEHRYSFLNPTPDGETLDCDQFYNLHAFPDTAKRMRFYEQHAFTLAKAAIDPLGKKMDLKDITHVIVTSCTGFYAPGLDLEIVEHYGMRGSVERTIIGFMGCYAAFNGLKSARHIVRSDAGAKVLVLNLELCTLHLQSTENIESLLSYLIFADGAAASIISSAPEGLELESFRSTLVGESRDQITWAIGSSGFDMVLSGKVPGTIARALPEVESDILSGGKVSDFKHWAIHPGGRSVLDTVQNSLDLKDVALIPSRRVLREYGNMSSATVMFVLKDIMDAKVPGRGCGLAFGPGVTVESMLFRLAG